VNHVGTKIPELLHVSQCIVSDFKMTLAKSELNTNLVGIEV